MSDNLTVVDRPDPSRIAMLVRYKALEVECLTGLGRSRGPTIMSIVKREHKLTGGTKLNILVEYRRLIEDAMPGVLSPLSAAVEALLSPRQKARLKAKRRAPTKAEFTADLLKNTAELNAPIEVKIEGEG